MIAAWMLAIIVLTGDAAGDFIPLVVYQNWQDCATIQRDLNARNINATEGPKIKFECLPTNGDEA